MKTSTPLDSATPDRAHESVGAQIGKGWLWAFGLQAATFIALAIAGGIRAFSAVPYEDMWDGYLDFFIRVGNGDWSAWWAQHNEHRILLTRLLFWMDLRWFGGANVFLIVINYVLVGLAVLVFWYWLRAVVADRERTPVLVVLLLMLASMLFCWSQYENMTLAFQSQFFLAQLLPLCALYWLQRSAVGDDTVGSFAVACGLGIAAVGTMANGIVALPLMALYAFMTKQKPRRTGLLVALSAASLLLYFSGYRAVPRHGSLSAALGQDPVGLVRFVLTYLGSPFYYILGADRTAPVSVAVAAAAGLSLIAGSIWFAIRAIRHLRESRVQLALLTFILYIGGTALGTAGGRLSLGMAGAVSSRYTTPAVMAWAALFVLFAPAAVASIRAGRHWLFWALAGLVLAMLPLQLMALKSNAPMLYERDLAAMALELGASDQAQIANVYPAADRALSVAKAASARHISIFGTPPLVGLGQTIGTVAPAPTARSCQGSLDELSAFGEDRFARIEGRFDDSLGEPSTRIVTLLDAENRIVGYALAGEPATGTLVAKVWDAPTPVFRGYVLASSAGQLLTVVSGSGEYQFSSIAPDLTLPDPPKER